MARVHSSTCNGQGKPKKCSSCGHVIERGEKYLWAKPGFRTRTPKIRCVNHPFRESDLTTGVRAEALVAREAFEDGLGGVNSFEELESLKDDLVSALEDYVNTRQEALDAWENGNSQLEEFVYQAEAARDEVESWSTDYDDTTEPDDDDLDAYKQDALSDGEPFSREDLVELWLQDRLDEAKDELSDVVSGLEL